MHGFITKGSKVPGKSAADSVIKVVGAQQPFPGFNSLMFGFISRFVGGVCRCIIKVILVLGVWQRDVRHLVFLQLHAVQVAYWSNWIFWRISSAVYTVNGGCGCCLCVFAFHCSPSFSIFATFIQVSLFLYFVAFRLFSFLSLEEVMYLAFPSLFFSGLATGLFLWRMVPRPRFHFAAFFAHRLSGSDAIFIAKRHFILLCVSIQHWILAAFILSAAVAVLLSMCSIRSSSSSISPVSISSSVSSVKKMYLSWSHLVFELLPSAVSSSELLWFCIFVFFVFVVLAGLIFLFGFSLCLDDEAKHFALSRSYHSFVFF